GCHQRSKLDTLHFKNRIAANGLIVSFFAFTRKNLLLLFSEDLIFPVHLLALIGATSFLGRVCPKRYSG
ncbi:MAG: hypothetical protein ABI850_19650, partial [Flavobacterium sp.]